MKGSITLGTAFYITRIRIRILHTNPDPAKKLNPYPDPEDFESGSRPKLFLNTM